MKLTLRGRNSLRGIAMIASGVLGAMAAPAAGQEFPRTGVLLTFDVSQRFETDSNLDLDETSPGSSTIATTRFNFGVQTDNGISSLDFGLGLAVRGFDVPTRSDNADWDNPDVRLAYTREGANAYFETRARYIRSDITFIRPLSDPLGDPDIPDLLADLDDLRGGGWREDRFFSTRLELGTASPIGFLIDVTYLDRRYDDTTSIDLYDNLRRAIDTETRFSISPVTDLFVRLGHERLNEFEAIPRKEQTTDFAIGVRHEFSEVLRVEASVGPSWVREEIAGVVTRETGIDGAFILTRDLPNGDVGFSFAADTDEDGTNTRLSVSRRIEIPDGEFSGSIGIARGPGGNTEVIGSADFRQLLAVGTLGVSLDRDITFSDTDGDETLTELSIEYIFPINDVSNFGIGLSTSLMDNRDTGAEEERTNFGLTYSYLLDNTWGLNVGYRHRLRDVGAGEAKSDVFFVTLNRHFDGTF